MAVPELSPGAALPWISSAGKPLYRCSVDGPVCQEVVANDENGTMLFELLRTDQLYRSDGTMR